MAGVGLSPWLGRRVRWVAERRLNGTTIPEARSSLPDSLPRFNIFRGRKSTATILASFCEVYRSFVRVSSLVSRLILMRELTYTKATHEALSEEMAKNPTIFVLGEGIGKRGGN